MLWAVTLAVSAPAARAQSMPNLMLFPNASGMLATYSVSSQPIDLSGPFFQALGSNGRSCSSCHRPAQGWTISAEEVKARFESTQGRDPIFRTNDGSNCDHNTDVSTVEARRNAYSLLIDRGLIRVPMPVPANAEFNVAGVVNPYGCGDPATLSVYRRPLPATNLRFLSAVMWDGRESSPQTGTQKILYPTNPGDLISNLAHQAIGATSGHAQGTVPLTPEQQQAIVDFETTLVTAQAIDFRAGDLDSGGAMGGPQALATQVLPRFYIGINDPLGGNLFGNPFTPVVFTLYDAWSKDQENRGNHRQRDVQRGSLRAAIVRGQTLFNSKPIAITGVAGLNDDLETAMIPGTCGTCHDSPNTGGHSVSAPLDIGVGGVDSPLDVSYLPVFTLQNKTTGEIKKTTDPGRALVTGLWKDVGRMKGPVLRGLAARPPYFHNGSAKSAADVVQFYDKRFNIGFTQQEKDDLVAFLNSL